ncbi:helix-turn-helix transcriptional regulator [Streptomyces sp. B1866]|uniref:helix-turn-helix domain-containing protein n=1 Tax=Streptomyces sp. B1866 TaxID=3075431 RepID=UPI00288D6066|nr:helix-turn-helix transcriptional regulator [Streptomyces sp. B1866]MDT3400510.1 helix-turn-helix transcriptional regulator [Streptomyces sp. B1866]
MGRVFYAYRTHTYHGRVLSQETVATWLGMDQAQLSRIESGEPPQDLRKLMSWAHSLKIPADLLWFKLPSNKRSITSGDTSEQPESPKQATQGGSLLPVVINGHPVMVPVDARTLEKAGLGSLLDQPYSITEHETMKRRSLFKGSLATAAQPGLSLDELQHVAAALHDARRYMDGSVVDYLRRQIESCKTDDGRLGPRKTLPDMLGLLGAIEEHARDVRPNIRRELLAVGADGAEFTGWLYRDIHQPLSASFWYDRAMEWAQEADDPAMQGYVLLKKSQMAYDERDAVRVLTLAQAAGRNRHQLPSRVQAEVAQQEALGFAMLGEPLDVVKQKLDNAHGLLTSITADEPPTLNPYFTENTLQLRNASSYTEAGKPAVAAHLFGEVIATGSLSKRDTGYFNARRAVAIALSGEPDEAASLGHQSAEVARALNSGRTMRVLVEVLRTLSRWGSRPAVREFREALHTAS